VSDAVMPLGAIAPFALILGLVLAVFLAVIIIEGYETPVSASDSLKRIFGSTGGWIGGFLVAHFFLNGLKFSDEIWASVFGAAAAMMILFVIDMVALRFKSGHQKNVGEGE
jgi:hypothetical protein